MEEASDAAAHCASSFLSCGRRGCGCWSCSAVWEAVLATGCDARWSARVSTETTQVATTCSSSLRGLVCDHGDSASKLTPSIEAISHH